MNPLVGFGLMFAGAALAGTYFGFGLWEGDLARPLGFVMLLPGIAAFAIGALILGAEAESEVRS